MNEEIDIILSRYFNGEISVNENQTLDEWLAKSEENEICFHEFSLLYQYAGQPIENPNFDTEKALSKFKTYITKKQKIKTSFWISNSFKAAAAIALLLIATFSLYYLLPKPSKTIRLTAVETQMEHELFNNTNVTLFPNTEITYRTKKENEITLQGKAIFTVDSKTTAVAIVVQAGETFIKDIGTVFTVDANKPNNFIKVEVAEGEVWFYTSTNTGVYIKANESALYDVQSKQFEMIPLETQLTPSLPSLQFQNTSLQEIIDMIRIYSGKDIVILSNELNEICLNVSFNSNESVENILAIISATMSARWSIKDGTYIITQ
jgi:ferric-dicitrate binding protein FerR (iron transport regulator)